MKIPKNVGASVRQKLLNHARAHGEDYNLLLNRYATERLLYRLGRSPHRDRFVLKGAALYAVWQSESGRVSYRATRDLDFWSSGAPDADLIVSLLREVVAVEIEDDGMAFDAAAIVGEVRRADEAYPGCNVAMEATLDGIALRVLIDFGFGDIITPRARTVEYPTILEGFPAPSLRIYPRETVVAEKFEAMVDLGTDNTRLKDFYDLWMLSRSFDFDGQTLSEAMRRTFGRRQTALPDAVPIALTEAFSHDSAKSNQWKNFGKRIRARDMPALSEVAEQLQRFLLPVAVGAGQGAFEQQWTPQNGWQPLEARAETTKLEEG